MSDAPIIVQDKSVACEGLVGGAGHPRVFLDLTKHHHVICPYCSQLYQRA